MKNRTRAEQLLDAALLDDSWHGASLMRVRRAARWRRWKRRGMRAGATASVCVLAAILLRFKGEETHVAPPAAVLPKYLVQSKPAPADLVVESTGHGLAVVTTSRGSVQVVSTSMAADSGPVPIDDEALREIAPGAVLVRLGNHTELVFPHAQHEPESRVVDEP
jgi:hypothetical protein